MTPSEFQDSSHTPPIDGAPSSSSDYYKALTVKVDRTRYEALKTAGIKADKKTQTILVEALDMWLEKNSA